MSASDEQDLTIDAATRMFREARSAAPDNLAATLRLGAILERQDRYWDALDIYNGFRGRWPRVFEVRYRCNAIQSMHNSWKDLSGASHDPELADVVDAAEGLRIDTFQQVVDEWDDLLRFVRLRSSLARYLGTFVPGGQRDRGYQRRFVRIGHTRKNLQVQLKLARLSTEIRVDAQPASSRHDEIKQRLGKSQHRNVLCVYNAACCASLLYAKTHDLGDLELAISYLSQVVRRGTPGGWVTSIQQDPDLEPIRSTPEFTNWFSDLTDAVRDAPHSRRVMN